MDFDISDISAMDRVPLSIGIALGVHISVLAIRWCFRHFMAATGKPSLNKVRTAVSLLTSTAIFVLYFGAVGFVLAEFGVSLQTYLASASIIGLAVAFGSQGVVQDVVTGVTVVFANLFDLGDMVEISGQTGIVQRFGMRFTVLSNANGAEVFIPNRTITNVIIYPRGYIRCLCDVTILPDHADDMTACVKQHLTSAVEQFPGILRAPAEVEAVETTSSGRTYMRLKFRIWPGRGGPIETVFKQELLQVLKSIDPTYQDWMISVSYEVEEQVRRGRRN